MSLHDTWGAEHRARGAAAPLPLRWRRPWQGDEVSRPVWAKYRGPKGRSYKSAVVGFLGTGEGAASPSH